MNDRKRGTACPSHNPRVTIPALLLLLTCSLAIPSAAQPQPKGVIKSTSVPSEQMRGLNNSVLQLHGQMQQASGSQAAGLRRQASLTIAQRAKALQRLIATDPKTALSFAFSPKLLADLSAKFPGSATLLESHVSVTGPVQHWIADERGFKSSHSWWVMSVGPSQSLTLNFAYHEPPQLKDGDFLQAQGVVAGNNMAVESATTIQPRAAAKPPQDIISAFDRNPARFASHRGWSLSTGLLSVLFGMALLAPDLRRLRARVRRLLQRTAVGLLAVSLLISAPSAIQAQNSCSTVGAQNTAVLMVNLPGGMLPTGVTQSSLQDVFFNTNTGVSLDGFLREASYGQTWATGNVFGPYNLTGSYASCSDVGGAILNDAVAAAVASGVNLNNYTRLFIVFPDVWGCGWQGFAQVGSCSLPTSSGTFNLSVAYLVADSMAPRASGVQLASHELGHNFGLLHSGTLTSITATDVIGPVTSPGTQTDLGDYWSTMGEAVLGLYTAPQKANVLGWLGSPSNYQMISSSGTYTLQPLEFSPPGLEVLQVQRGTGNAGYYLWVEYRQPEGNYDSTLLNFVYSGALIHYQDPTTNPAHSYLPNFTPSDTTGNNPELAAGRTWNDPYTNLSLSVVSATSAGLTLNVSYGSVPCTPANPTVSVSPLNPSIYAGKSAAYSLSVTNNDSSGCSASTYTLNSTQPSGWPTSFSSASLTLSPGQSGSATMTLTGPAGTPVGTYAVNAIATNNSYVGSGTANITVMSAPALTVSLSIPSSTYNRKSTVPITATVLSGGAPASGATVTFTLTTPTSSTVTQSATAGSNGVATWNYKIGPKSLTGTYSVSAQAVLSVRGGSAPQPATSNVVNFTVQ